MTDNLIVLKERFNREPCFNYLEIKLCELKDGYALLKLELENHLTNTNGVIMGGVIFTLLDAVSPYAAMTMKDENEEVATIKSEVFFKTPLLTEHKTLLAETTEIEKLNENNRKYIKVKSQAYFLDSADNKRIVAESVSLFAVLPAEILNTKLEEARKML